MQMPQMGNSKMFGSFEQQPKAKSHHAAKKTAKKSVPSAAQQPTNNMFGMPNMFNMPQMPQMQQMQQFGNPNMFKMPPTAASTKPAAKQAHKAKQNKAKHSKHSKH